MKNNNYRPKDRLPSWMVDIICAAVVAALALYAFRLIYILINKHYFIQ